MQSMWFYSNKQMSATIIVFKTMPFSPIVFMKIEKV